MKNIGLIGCGNIAETYFRAQDYFNNINFIACADKLSEAMAGMTELLDAMPEAESNMINAKEAIEQKITSARDEIQIRFL